ncbi:type I-F CRISPR-associated protein Csy2 [Klebsiella oxytoca]|nr:type I-F CRISPR-associated protein Csy2 [Klebsiella oxytoca]
MHIRELLKIKDHSERDRALRHGFSPIREKIDMEGFEYETLVVLLNMTLKRDLVHNLFDVRLARQLLFDKNHLAHCVNAVRWLHTHNLKYPDSRVRGQRLIICSPAVIPGIVSSADLPQEMGWANNGADINFARLFCSFFRHNGSITCLAKLLTEGCSGIVKALERLGTSTDDICLLRVAIANNISESVIPSDVSIYSRQLRGFLQGKDVAITPVVSHALMARLQQLIYQQRKPHIIIRHDHPASMGNLVASTGGNIAVMYYPPLVSVHKERSFIHSRVGLLQEREHLFDNNVLREKELFNALQNLVSHNGGSQRQIRQQRLSALRYLRYQLVIWLKPVIECIDALEENREDILSLPESIEKKVLTQSVNRLDELSSELAGHFHLSLQHHPLFRRFAFHSELVVSVESQLKWILKNISRSDPDTPITQSCREFYLHLSGLNIYDASAMSNPYLCGIPSLTALAGFCHDYERRVSALMEQKVCFTEVAWYIGHYNLISGRQLPAAMIPERKNTISSLRRPGITDEKCCDMGIELVIKLQFPEECKLPESGLLYAASPSRFAGGVLHPPSFSGEKSWCQLYSDQDALYSVLSRLPGSGCWIYPVRTTITTLEEMFTELSSDYRLRPVSSGFILLEEMQYRAGSLASQHVYAESALGLARCHNPIEIRLAGKKNFYNQGFWPLDYEDRTIIT